RLSIGLSSVLQVPTHGIGRGSSRRLRRRRIERCGRTRSRRGRCRRRRSRTRSRPAAGRRCRTRRRPARPARRRTPAARDRTRPRDSRSRSRRARATTRPRLPADVSYSSIVIGSGDEKPDESPHTWSGKRLRGGAERGLLLLALLLGFGLPLGLALLGGFLRRLGLRRLLALLAAHRPLGARHVARRIEEVQVPLGAREVARRHLLRLAGGRRATRALHRRLPHVGATQEVEEPRLTLHTNLRNLLGHPDPPREGVELVVSLVNRRRRCQLFCDAALIFSDGKR